MVFWKRLTKGHANVGLDFGGYHLDQDISYVKGELKDVSEEMVRSGSFR